MKEKRMKKKFGNFCSILLRNKKLFESPLNINSSGGSKTGACKNFHHQNIFEEKNFVVSNQNTRLTSRVISYS